MDKIDLAKRLLNRADEISDMEQKIQVLCEAAVRAHQSLKSVNASHRLLGQLSYEEFGVDGDSFTSVELKPNSPYLGMKFPDYLKAYASDMTEAAASDLL